MFVGDHNVSSSVPLISSDPVQPNKKSVLANIGNHIGETANNFLEALPVANRIVHWANERYGVAEERDRFLCARINDLTAALRDIFAQFDIRETEDLKLKLLQADPHERQVIYQNILKELILKAILAERSQSLPATEGESSVQNTLTECTPLQPLTLTGTLSTMDTADVNHCSVPAAPALVVTTFPEVFAHEESKQYKEIRRLLEILAALCLSQSAEQLCSQLKEEHWKTLEILLASRTENQNTPELQRAETEAIRTQANHLSVV